MLFAATHVEPCPTTFRPPAVPVPSTPLSSETVTGVVVDEESWQLSDTYRPVELPVDGCVAAYEIASVTRDAEPALPASAGAVPRTAIFPFTADCQVVPIASVPDVAVVGVSVEHFAAELGSPMTRAEYAENWDAVIASQVAGVT